MAEGATLTFSDPDGYAAAFGDIRVNLTITGAGDFNAQLIRLKLNHLEVYCCRESLPRIAYVSLPTGWIFLSFPVGKFSSILGGIALRKGDMVFHSGGERHWLPAESETAAARSASDVAAWSLSDS